MRKLINKQQAEEKVDLLSERRLLPEATKPSQELLDLAWKAVQTQNNYLLSEGLAVVGPDGHLVSTRKGYSPKTD